MKHRLARPVMRAATTLYRHLNTPRALTAFILLQAGEWDQLVTLTMDPRTYLDTPSGAEKFRKDTQATDFLRKCDAVPASFDRKAAALKSFYQCEEQCAVTNYFIDHLICRQGISPVERESLRILRRARKIIKRLVGPVPASLMGRFGPGTSFELQGSAFSTLADKLWVTPAVTRDAYAVWRHTVDGTILDRRRLELGLPDHQVVRGNRFTTVPKDAKTDRGICVEPLGNLYCQLGVGSYLKGRLANVGLYVNRNNTPVCPIKRLRTRPSPNGQFIHRQLAAIASRTGEWATIDLSNASDTVAYNLVRELMPPDWFSLLSALRSPFTRVDKTKWVRLEKFSSMGNGFTFELETLIFAALAAAVSDLTPGMDLFVYGDDIIVPTRASNDVLAILRNFGFTPNEKKTFTQGPFRESCGGDYFLGFDVRPVILDREPRTPMEWIALHNHIRRKFPSAKHTLRVVIEQLPEVARVFGPSRLDDTVLHTDDSHRWRPKIKDGIKTVLGLVAEATPIPLARWGDEFTVSLALLGVSSRGLVPRDSALSWKRVPLSIS